VLSKKLLLSYLLVGFICLFGLFGNSGCANNNNRIKIEDRGGLLYIHGQNELFTGRIIDTVANKILEYEVIDGKKNGEFKISSLEGSVEILGTLKDNLNVGQWCYYYPNGQIESVGNFENNLTEGKWTWYFENGKVREIGNFKAGKKDGTWTIFDEKGKIKRKIFFNNGQIVDDQECNKELFT
jgi:antitoxin component YwqK of YwqJK toxin-antitoxin module